MGYKAIYDFLKREYHNFQFDNKGVAPTDIILPINLFHEFKPIMINDFNRIDIGKGCQLYLFNCRLTINWEKGFKVYFYDLRTSQPLKYIQKIKEYDCESFMVRGKR